MSELSRGSYIFIKGHACVVLVVATSKSGKHGAAKMLISAHDVFRDDKLELLVGSGEAVTTAEVKRDPCSIVSCDPAAGTVTAMTDSGETFDIPTDFSKEPSAGYLASFNEGSEIRCVLVTWGDRRRVD